MPMEMQTYREGRAAAGYAAEELLEALASLGLPESALRSIRPMVTHKGAPYVHMGMMRAEAVMVIVEAIKHGTD